MAQSKISSEVALLLERAATTIEALRDGWASGGGMNWPKIVTATEFAVLLYAASSGNDFSDIEQTLLSRGGVREEQG